MSGSEALETLVAQFIEDFAGGEMGLRRPRVRVGIGHATATVRFAYAGWGGPGRPASEGHRALLQRLLALVFARFRPQLERLVVTYVGVPIADVRTAIDVERGEITQTYVFAVVRAPRRSAGRGASPDRASRRSGPRPGEPG